jgi:hypothetical protein
MDADDWRSIGYRIVPSKDSPPTLRGTDVHSTCENYLLGKVEIAGLHAEIRPAWRNLVGGLRNLGAVPEQQWEFEEGWHPHEGGQVWLRMKIDAHYRAGSTLHVIDFKTGKPYPQNIAQVEVYALGAFAKHDDVDTVIGELWYFDHEETHEKTFTRSEAPKLARRWEQRADRLLTAVQYPARRNPLCQWCPYHESKGGPCTPPA